MFDVLLINRTLCLPYSRLCAAYLAVSHKISTTTITRRELYRAHQGQTTPVSTQIVNRQYNELINQLYLIILRKSTRQNFIEGSVSSPETIIGSVYSQDPN